MSAVNTDLGGQRHVAGRVSGGLLPLLMRLTRGQLRRRRGTWPSWPPLARTGSLAASSRSRASLLAPVIKPAEALTPFRGRNGRRSGNVRDRQEVDNGALKFARRRQRQEWLYSPIGWRGISTQCLG